MLNNARSVSVVNTHRIQEYHNEARIIDNKTKRKTEITKTVFNYA